LYVEQATTDQQARGDARSDSTLQTAGDLIGQAYASPAHAAGILEAAASHVRSLTIRAEVAMDVLEAARKDLLPPAASPALKPTTKRS
jgi:hypothetical protein